MMGIRIRGVTEGSCFDNDRFLEVCGSLACSGLGEDRGGWEAGQGVRDDFVGMGSLSSSLLVSD